MNITVNGEPQALGDGATLAELVAARLPTAKGVAAAVDGTVAPRTSWADVRAARRAGRRAAHRHPGRLRWTTTR